MEQLIIDAQHTEVVMLQKHHMVQYQNNVMHSEMVIFMLIKINNIILVNHIKQAA